MSASGKGLLGLWLYRSAGGQWALKEGPPVSAKLQRSISRDAAPNEVSVEGHKDSLSSVVFSLKNQVGGLARALQVFQDLGVNVIHIESRPSSRKDSEYEILVDVECDAARMEQLVRGLRREVAAINLARFEQGEDLPPPTPLSASASFDFGEMPWFPRKISDLDRAQRVLMYGSELDADHPESPRYPLHATPAGEVQSEAGRAQQQTAEALPAAGQLLRRSGVSLFCGGHRGWCRSRLHCRIRCAGGKHRVLRSIVEFAIEVKCKQVYTQSIYSLLFSSSVCCNYLPMTVYKYKRLFIFKPCLHLISKHINGRRDFFN